MGALLIFQSMSAKKATKSVRQEVVTREYTINLHKRLHSSTFKKRAPRAVRAIRKFATVMMGTEDVRVHPQLNKAVWGKGVKNVPHPIRVRCERRRNDDEDAKEKLYTIITWVAVDTTAPGKASRSSRPLSWSTSSRLIDADAGFGFHG